MPRPGTHRLGGCESLRQTQVGTEAVDSQSFGIPIRAFDRAVADGLIRNAKFGESCHAARLFLVRDCERYLMELAAGRKPT